MDPKLAPFVVRPTDSLEDAMVLIEANRHRSVVVTDERGVVVGTLSDGDLRKAILDHRLLSTPVGHVMNTNFLSVGLDERDRGRELLEHEHVFVIPIVDADGALVDLVLAYE